MSNYEVWLGEERKWIKGYQRKVKRKLLIIFPIVMVLVGLLSAFIACGEGENITNVVIARLVITTIFYLFFFLIANFTLRPKKYIRKIKRSLDILGMDEREKEEFAREMLEGTSQQIEFTYNGHGASNVQARIRITPHYVYLQGGFPYANIVRLSDIKVLKKKEKRQVHKTYGAKIKTYEYYESYVIDFYKNEVEELADYEMEFYEEELRDRVFDIIKQQESSES